MELGVDPDALANPWHAAWASFLAFTVASVLAALALTGWSSARLGAGAPPRAVLRNVAGGALAMGVAYAAGALLGASGV